MNPKSRDRTYRRKILGIPAFLVWILLLVIIIVIAVPIGVMFGRKKHLKTRVLVPLYVYPDPGVWQPLYNAVETNPKLHFTVVINPNSGPGDAPLPDNNYTAAVTVLNKYPNVELAGYVSTNYSNRDVGKVIKDVQTYANWSMGDVGFGKEGEKQAGIGVNGIFLDETPNEWSVSAGSFYQRVAGVIRSLGEDPLIIHNPGTIPSPNFLPFTNLVVIFEGAYSTYISENFGNNITSFSKTTKFPRDKLASIVHSMPEKVDQKTVVRTLRKTAGSVFLTGLSVDYYESFWVGFGEWVKELGKK